MMSSRSMGMGVRSSTLNPNAPLFIPAAYQQVEGFSPEWWELVNTTSWFRDHWFRQHHHQDEQTFDLGITDECDVASLLPESFDLGITDECSNLDEAFYAAEEQDPLTAGLKEDGLKNGGWGAQVFVNTSLFDSTGVTDAEALIRSLTLESPMNGAAMPVLTPIGYHEKPQQYVSPKLCPRRTIQ